MREEVSDVVVLFEAAEAHMSLVDFFAVLETGEVDWGSWVEFVIIVQVLWLRWAELGRIGFEAQFDLGQIVPAVVHYFYCQRMTQKMNVMKVAITIEK